LSRAAKRRAIEGVLEEHGMEFSDVGSDDCRELTDSIDDDGAISNKEEKQIKKNNPIENIMMKQRSMPMSSWR
jgi:hypothetical protein